MYSTTSAAISATRFTRRWSMWLSGGAPQVYDRSPFLQFFALGVMSFGGVCRIPL